MLLDSLRCLRLVGIIWVGDRVLRGEWLLARMLASEGDVILGMEVAGGDPEGERKREKFVDTVGNVSAASNCQRASGRAEVVLHIDYDQGSPVHLATLLKINLRNGAAISVASWSFAAGM